MTTMQLSAWKNVTGRYFAIKCNTEQDVTAVATQDATVYVILLDICNRGNRGNRTLCDIHIDLKIHVTTLGSIQRE